jgi:hypothetical protein
VRTPDNRPWLTGSFWQQQDRLAEARLAPGAHRPEQTRNRERSQREECSYTEEERTGSRAGVGSERRSEPGAERRGRKWVTDAAGETL